MHRCTATSFSRSVAEKYAVLTEFRLLCLSFLVLFFSSLVLVFEFLFSST
jgi:hypothetical protein